MQPREHALNAEPDYTTNRLFTNAILYGLPAAVLATIFTQYTAWHNGRSFMALFGPAMVLAVACVALNRRLSMAIRKFLVSGALLIMGVVLIVLRGVLGLGCVYLLTYSIFYALHFSPNLVRRAMAVNVAICIAFSFGIYLKLFHVGAIASVTLEHWVTQSINFLFLNLVIVVMIRQTIGKLEHTMHTETDINRKLQVEFEEKQLLNESLQRSEKMYKTLFSSSPSAKLIFDVNSLCFLETNNAASMVYGYTEAQFRGMRLTDLHQPEDIPALLKQMEGDSHADNALSTIRSRHVRKDGTVIVVDLLRCNIELKGKLARLIVVNDVTQQVEQLSAIQKQNAKLKEIAYIQSHLVRLPLTRIMALTDLIADEYKYADDQQLLSALVTSSNELDQLIRRIVNESATVLTELEGYRNDQH